MAIDARVTDDRAARLLKSIPDNTFVLKINFPRERQEGDWVLEDKFDPVKTEKKKGQGVVEITRETKPGTLTGVDQVFYQIAYPVTAVVYGLYPLKDPNPGNLAPMRVGDLKCVAQRLVEYFEGALRGQGLTPTRRTKIH